LDVGGLCKGADGACSGAFEVFGARGVFRHETKILVSEEKTQKTFVTLATRQPGHARLIPKFFGSFFKKEHPFRHPARRTSPLTGNSALKQRW
jgi:hypothetical protein